MISWVWEYFKFIKFHNVIPELQRQIVVWLFDSHDFVKHRQIILGKILAIYHVLTFVTKEKCFKRTDLIETLSSSN